MRAEYKLQNIPRNRQSVSIAHNPVLYLATLSHRRCPFNSVAALLAAASSYSARTRAQETDEWRDGDRENETHARKERDLLMPRNIPLEV
jgi:hypothetical protein